MKPTRFWKFGQAICRPYTSVMFDLKVYGREHVPKTGGVLIVSNHQSYLDPVLLGVQIERPMSYLAKSELFIPGFGALIRALNAYPVRQGEGDVGAMRETIRRLQEGHMLNIFPEGTRTLTGEIEALQPGVALVIRRANVPVIPAVIDGSFKAWRKGHIFPQRTPIRVQFRPRLEVENLKAAKIVELIEQTLHRMLRELRARENAR